MGFHHNNMIKKHKKVKQISVRLGILTAAVVFAVAMVGQMFSAPVAEARDYSTEIKALENQISDYNKRSDELAKQSDTLQGRIDQLQNEQNEIQSQIDLNTAKRDQLNQQIADNEQKIKDQSESLSDTLQDMYYSSKTSSLDIIMNSNSVSDYVDRQTRQKSMSDQISDSVNEVKQLKADLEKSKAAVEKVMSELDQQKKNLQASKDEQQKLLDETQGQEAKFKELTEKKHQELSELQAKQAAENDRRKYFSFSGAVCGGGYPAYLCNAMQDSLVDPWGMYNRECVSYAAYKVASTYGWPSNWPRGGNDAKNWINRAHQVGLKVSSTPAPGTVAVSTSGPYGHVAWVESVSGSTITVSQFNYYGKFNNYRMGEYSVMEMDASEFDGYIYFN